MSDRQQAEYHGYRHHTHALQLDGGVWSATVIYWPPGHPINQEPHRNTLDGFFDTDDQAHEMAEIWFRGLVDSGSV